MDTLQAGLDFFLSERYCFYRYVNCAIIINKQPPAVELYSVDLDQAAIELRKSMGVVAVALVPGIFTDMSTKLFMQFKQLLNMCMGFNFPQECSCCGWYSLAVMVVFEDTEVLCGGVPCLCPCSVGDTQDQSQQVWGVGR